MTTHTPYEPPPEGTYPTSPPWAPPPPVAKPTPPWAPEPSAVHGRLMVPYPEEMFNATRPTPPAWFPVVIWTALFGPLGAISAARRAGLARLHRNDRHPYWIAFGATLAAGLAAWTVAASVLIPAYLSVRESAVTKSIQSGLTKSTDGAAKASCEPTGARAADGLRAYHCTVTLTNGRTNRVQVKADPDGNWKITK